MKKNALAQQISGQYCSEGTEDIFKKIKGKKLQLKTRKLLNGKAH